MPNSSPRGGLLGFAGHNSASQSHIRATHRASPALVGDARITNPEARGLSAEGFGTDFARSWNVFCLGSAKAQVRAVRVRLDRLRLFPGETVPSGTGVLSWVMFDVSVPAGGVQLATLGTRFLRQSLRCSRCRHGMSAVGLATATLLGERSPRVCKRWEVWPERLVGSGEDHERTR